MAADFSSNQEDRPQHSEKPMLRSGDAEWAEKMHQDTIQPPNHTFYIDMDSAPFPQTARCPFVLPSDKIELHSPRQYRFSSERGGKPNAHQGLCVRFVSLTGQKICTNPTNFILSAIP
ncbi:hypothetical protein BCS37_11165 [Selenomonas sp. oral taxon 920]|nr:hypothetical protein BCS37_11165 [Selenomonas sp. oral taxon 920]